MNESQTSLFNYLLDIFTKTFHKHLKFNTSKTELLISTALSSKFPFSVFSLSFWDQYKQVRNLDIMFDFFSLFSPISKRPWSLPGSNSIFLEFISAYTFLSGMHWLKNLFTFLLDYYNKPIVSFLSVWST